MAVDTESDVELIEALDFDPEIPCNLYPSSAGEHAVWVIRCKGEGCNTTEFACDEHRTQFVRWVNSIGAVCLACGRKAYTAEECVDIVPIKAMRDDGC